MSAGPGRAWDPGTDDPRVGEVVAHKYRLDRVVASGGMGTVFEAEHLRLGRRVAVKLLHPDHLTDPERIKRFHKEARKAASLAHPGIVEVRDFGHDEKAGPYLEMELLEGVSVEQLLRAHGPLPMNVALYITCEALDSLAVAHARNIVHRDIKPNNLFVSLGEAQDVRVKVLDFGIARIFTSELEGFALEEDTFSETLTKTGVLLGTLNYMSPEQFADARHVDHRADIYSMGATLFELLTNTPVVSGSTVFECVTHVTNGEILRHPQVYRSEIPKWLDALVAQSLALYPGERFPSATAMREAIDSHTAIDNVATRVRLGELAAHCVHHGPSRVAISQASTRMDGAVSPESGPVVVIADADSGIRPQTTGSSAATASAPGPPSADTLPSASTVDARPEASPRPARGGLRTAVLVALALAVGAGVMALVDYVSPPRDPDPRSGTQPAAQEPPTNAGAPDLGNAPAPDTREPGPAEEATPAPEADEITSAAADDDLAVAAEAEEPAIAALADDTIEVPAEQPEEQAEEAARGRARQARHRAHRRSRSGASAASARSEPTNGRAGTDRGDSGMLTVNTIPASHVYIDGNDTGHTTPLNGFNVPAGPHHLELRLPDGTSHTYPIRVEAGESVRIFRVLPH